MKKLYSVFVALLILIFLPIEAQASVWYACTVGGNWSANVWTSVSADQGTCAASLGTPVAGDTAVLNSSSGNITITSAAAAASLTMTGYTGTLAIGAQTLTMSGGTVTLATGNTITASTGGMTITGTETLISGGKTWPGTLTFNVAGTVTLNNGGATWTNTGLCTFSAATNVNLTTTGDTLTCNGGLTMNSGSGTSPTATIILGGGTWTGNHDVYNNLTLAGNVTVSSNVDYINGTLTYSSGTITVTGSTLNIAGSCTLNTSGMTWATVSGTGVSPTITLTSALSTSVLSLGDNGSQTFSGAYNITTATLNILGAGSTATVTFVSGQTLNVTSVINITGGVAANTIKSGTSSSPTYINYTGTVANDNMSGGNIFTDVTASGNVLYNYNGGTLTRTSNIINVTASNIQNGTGFIVQFR